MDPDPEIPLSAIPNNPTRLDNEVNTTGLVSQTNTHPIECPKTLSTHPHGSTVISVMLAEYNTLRTESLNAINNSPVILAFSFASGAIILAGLITRTEKDTWVGVVTMVSIPILVKCCLLIWFAEYERCERAGNGIRRVESRINAYIEFKGALDWESRLLKDYDELSYSTIGAFTPVLGTGWVAYALGLRLLRPDLVRRFPSNGALVPIILISIAIIVMEASCLLWFYRKWISVRKKWSLKPSLP